MPAAVQKNKIARVPGKRAIRAQLDCIAGSVDFDTSQRSAAFLRFVVTEALAADPGVAEVSDPVVSTDGGVALWQVVPTSGPADPATEELVDRLRADPTELNSLYKDLLIGVTKFFRDQDAFARLQQEVVAAMKAQAKDNRYNFPYLRDRTQETAATFGAAATPDVFLFDQDRRLRYRGRIGECLAKPDVRQEKARRHFPPRPVKGL